MLVIRFLQKFGLISTLICNIRSFLRRNLSKMIPVLRASFASLPYKSGDVALPEARPYRRMKALFSSATLMSVVAHWLEIHVRCRNELVVR